MNDWIMLYFRSHTNCYIRAIIYLTSDLFCSDKNNGQDRQGLPRDFQSVSRSEIDVFIKIWQITHEYLSSNILLVFY